MARRAEQHLMVEEVLDRTRQWLHRASVFEDGAGSREVTLCRREVVIEDVAGARRLNRDNSAGPPGVVSGGDLEDLVGLGPSACRSCSSSCHEKCEIPMSETPTQAPWCVEPAP